MRYWDTLATYQRSGFDIIVDKTWEEIALADSFDDTCFDIRDMERKVNSGELDWFMLRVRVMFEGHEFAEEYLGGCLYEDASECLTDGTAEDVIHIAIEHAKSSVQGLAGKLWALQMELDFEAVSQ